MLVGRDRLHGVEHLMTLRARGQGLRSRLFQLPVRVPRARERAAVRG